MQTEAADLTLPSKPDNLSNLEFVRNLTPYVAVRAIVGGKSVADVGCGTGHGAWLLAKSGAERVAAVDIDQERIRQVAALCGDVDNVNASVMDAQHLDFDDESFQVVACFEVIEHLPRPDMLLSGIRRILARGGVAAITTPNRRVRLLPLQRPWNREHLREYTLGGFQSALAKHFPSLTVLGLYADSGPDRHYRELWRQSFGRAYFGWTLKPVRLLRRLLAGGRSAQPGSAPPEPASPDSALLNTTIPSPQADAWPFHVGDLDGHCLNFLALGGFDDETIGRAAHEIRASTG